MPEPQEDTQQEEGLFKKLNSPSPFNFNAQLYKTFRPRGEKLEATPLEENQLLNDIEAVSREFLSGELPEDVIDQIERNAAEQTIQGGLGNQQGRNLEARDLGLSSLDLVQKGASVGLGVSQLQTQRDQFNKNIVLETAKYNESVRQWNDQFALKMVESDLSHSQLALGYLELESMNRQFRAKTEATVLLANAELEVPGAQDFLDNLAETFDPDIHDEVSRALSRLT